MPLAEINSSLKRRNSWTIFIVVFTLLTYCLPFLILNKNQMMDYGVRDTPIYEAIQSIELVNGIYTLIGICIPVSIEYVLDVAYYGSMDKESGYFHRGMLILSAWIPNLLVLCVISLRDDSLYVPLLYQVRITTYLICIFTYLHEFGGPVTDGHLFYFLALCTIVGSGMKFLISMSSLSTISVLAVIMFAVFVVLIVTFCYNWIRYIRNKRSNHSLSRGDMMCTCYLITLVIGTLLTPILHFRFDVTVDINSTANDLLVHQTLSCAVILALSMTHGRFLRFEMNITQVISTNFSSLLTVLRLNMLRGSWRRSEFLCGWCLMRSGRR